MNDKQVLYLGNPAVSPRYHKCMQYKRLTHSIHQKNLLILTARDDRLPFLKKLTSKTA